MSEVARFLTDVIVFGLLTSNAITLCALRARITDLEKRINKLTEENERMEWIPCSKRLPTKEEQDDELGVLVTLGNGYSGLQFDYYYNGLWDDWNGYVVAWMPLPKPYGCRDSEKPNNSKVSEIPTGSERSGE